MGTSNKNTAKTATVMNLISRRPQPKTPAIGNVSDSDTSGSLPTAREQIEYIDIDRIDDDPRNFYELSGLDELAANIELLGLQQPIRVRPGEEPGRYVIVSGHRRRAAVRKLVMDGHGELRNIQCIVERGQESDALQELRLIMANSDTRKLTSFELGKQAERVNDLLYQLQEEGVEFPGRMRDHVAEACKVSKSKLARLKVIGDNLAKPWRPAYEKGKLAEATAYALAQMPAERQQVIFDGLKKQGEYPTSVYESEVTSYGKSLAQAEKIQCKTYGNGPCLNREAMQRRIMDKGPWNFNYCCQCCDKCSDEELSDFLADWLYYGVDEVEGVLGILYRALWAMAEIRARLSRYEDTGLMPDDVERLAAQESNTPLTLEELREMDGEPVWSSYYQCWGLISVHSSGKWAGVPFFLFTEDGCRHERNVEQRRLTLYRRKPEALGGEAAQALSGPEARTREGA
ncbi:MAG: ParB N-terminal domain-containing protein [Oscillospiraceae bacterium]|nr:ParB N-terminal domain-containing protein [Oscillospiraceae bacterium]